MHCSHKWVEIRDFPVYLVHNDVTMAASPDVYSLYKDGSDCAGGARDVFIIASIGEVSDPTVVPREDAEVTEEDRSRLTSQGIPPGECTDDLSIIRARFSLDKRINIVGVEVSEPGRELTRDYVLETLESVFTNCKRDGVIIHYFGHGKKNTGDWCFQDGFIIFRDIVSLYSKHFRGRVLTLITDCSHSGQWVKAAFQYMEEQGVKPCGHSAVEKGILLKVYTACQSEEMAAGLSFSVRGMKNNKNSGRLSYVRSGTVLQKGQVCIGPDFTELRCGKAMKEQCALSTGYSWEKWREAQRIYLVRGMDHGRLVWHYILLLDDEQGIRTFLERMQGSNAGQKTINVADYGQVLKSGWGEDPPNDVRDWIEKNYQPVYK